MVVFSFSRSLIFPRFNSLSLFLSLSIPSHINAYFSDKEVNKIFVVVVVIAFESRLQKKKLKNKKNIFHEKRRKTVTKQVLVRDTSVFETKQNKTKTNQQHTLTNTNTLT